VLSGHYDIKVITLTWYSEFWATSAYETVLGTAMIELASRPADGPQDGLFAERLQTFMKRSLTEMKAFSEREQRPFEDVCTTAIHIYDNS
jgi:hypothetical protein